MILNVKNMVCRHCVSVLRQTLTQMGFDVKAAGLGYAEISATHLSPEQTVEIKEKLAEVGFELIEGKDRQLVETVKHEILRHINSDEPCQLNLSHCISHATGLDYKYVSRRFSIMEGRTIEKFYVTAKVEKVKELLSYGDVPLTEIAYLLGYSSVAFLSRQFKQETGMTPTQYLKGSHDRKSFAEI